MPEKNARDTDDALAREVDRLLRKLPGADPYLRGDPEPAATAAPAQPSARTAVLGPPVRGRGRVPGPTPIQRLTVWLRVGLGVLLGVLVLQWPYARGCGVGLGLYLTGLGVVVLGGTWGGIWSWRYRMALAHAASLAVIYWGLLLVAHEVLQRAGYAAASAAWSCGT